MKFVRASRALCVLAGLLLSPGAVSPVRGRSQETPPADRQQTDPRPSDARRFWEQGAKALSNADYAAAETALLAGLRAAERAGDKGWQARCLTYLGFVYSNTGRQRNVIACLVRALPLYKALGDWSNVGYTLGSLGNAHALLGEQKVALQLFQRALKVVQTLPGGPRRVKRVAGSHTALGLVYRALNRPGEAAAHLSRARRLYETVNDSAGVARTLTFLGSLYSETGRPAQALEAHRRALRLQEHLPGGARDAAFSLLSLGGVYSSLHQYAVAATVQKRALAAFERLNERALAARCLFSLAQTHALAGDYGAALAAARRALALQQGASAPNRWEIGQTYELLARIYELRGEYDAAFNAAARALAVFQSLGDKWRAAQSLAQQGAVLDRLGRYDAALDCLSRAVAMLEAGKNGNNDAQTASGLMSLGGVYDSLGQFDNASAIYRRALALWEARGNAWQSAHCLLLLALTYARQGDRFDAALAAGRRALALLETTSDREARARALSQIGSVYLLRGQARNNHPGDLDNARLWYRRALRAYQSLRSERGVAECLVALGLASAARRRYDQALFPLNRALALAQALNDRYLVDQSLAGLAVVYRERGQFGRARKFALRALGRARARRNRRDIAYSLNQLGRIYEKQERPGPARATLAQAIREYEIVGEQVGDPGQAGAFQQINQQDLYVRYAALLARAGRPADALVVVERGRARGLALQAGENRANAGLLSPADARARRQRLAAVAAAQRRLSRAQNRLERAVSPGEKSAGRAAVVLGERGLLDAERALVILRADLYRRYPRYKRLRGAGDPATPARLLALARRNPDTLYLEWVVDEKKTLVFALSGRNGLQTLTLPIGRRALAPAVARWRTALAAGASLGGAPARARRTLLGRARDELAAATTLSRRLLPRLERAGLLRPGRHARLVIVPDGPLLDVPFAALVDANNKRLIERYAVSTSVSLGMLTWPQNTREPAATLLCVADPAGTAPNAKQNAPSLRRHGRGGTAALFHARDEARRVARLFPGATLLTGPRARESVVKRQIGRYALLHFATHGQLARPGLRSWLRLAPEPARSPENGRWEAREIAGQPLSARLAVLSACDSGRGEASGGDGLLGLAWAFQAAGCSSVVASQWKVDDAATRVLMIAFYQALRAGRRKDDALRLAMQKVHAVPGWGGPGFWAAFQIIGDASPLVLSRPAPTAAASAGGKHRQRTGKFDNAIEDRKTAAAVFAPPATCLVSGQQWQKRWR